MSSKKKSVIDRTPTNAPSKLGTATFTLGRLSDAPLQYFMFTEGWAVKALTSVGIRASSLLLTTGPGVAGLAPIPTLMTGMYAVAGLRHAYWVLFTNSYDWKLPEASMVVLYNTFLNTTSSLVAAHALTSSPLPILGDRLIDCIGWKQWAGITLFTTGIAIELISEQTRKAFKKDLRNKGKIDDTGLWGLVRHPNYLGYTLWRTGIMLTTGSLTASALMAVFQIIAFTTGGIPDISAHMADRYGAQWEDYKQRVPSALIPGIL
ncbi:S5A-REDUCTASE domain-containing protein [Mycena indigotica]|uniref:S5A-REDUCTASE domain-containing protein n=1 Tax=Mycena indigotica TaxID=2126181 RepID=A0A8H6VZA0_9AGAR|nr:S5A-REDUCTASE domain-containing protein [Mycena indigotica]KAF7297316.1 S5A-REDUCTASE domain-containing protein [Mycena indigotica]